MSSKPFKRLWPLGLYRVFGSSMQPALRPGQVVLGYRWGHPRAGRIVVVAQHGRRVIKRVERIDSDGVWLLGDNAAASTDSRQFGLLPLEAIEAVIIASSGRNR